MLVDQQSWKKTYRHDLGWQLPREVKFLQQLSHYNGFPQIKGWADNYVWMSHCGKSAKAAIKRGLSVEQVEDQLMVLVAILIRERIRHRDITANNLLWHPEKGLHLIDFGWSTWVDEKDTPVPIPHVMRPWMCDNTDLEQAVETMKGLRAVEAPKQ